MNQLPVGQLTAVSPYICIMQDVNDSADTKSARHGQNQEKEKIQLLK